MAKKKRMRQKVDPLDRLGRLVDAIQAANGQPEYYDLEIARLRMLFCDSTMAVRDFAARALRPEFIEPKPQPDPDQADLLIDQIETLKEGHLAILSQFHVRSASLSHLRLATDQRLRLGVKILETVVECKQMRIGTRKGDSFFDVATNMALHLLTGRTTNT